jgi:dimethylargininase
MLMALTRVPSPTIADCYSTSPPEQRIDFQKALRQRRAYIQALLELGLTVICVLDGPEQPFGVFVEDGAVVLDEIAIMTRQGAKSRRKEGRVILPTLSLYRPLVDLKAPAELDGGDVLRVGDMVYVGVSKRTNNHGVNQLRDILEPYGYNVTPVTVSGCSHLKSGCTYLGRNTILINKDWIDAAPFKGFDTIDVCPTEQWAANTLPIGDVVLMPSSFPQTRRRLGGRGFKVRALDISEYQKAGAGLTCMSIIFESEVQKSGSKHYVKPNSLKAAAGERQAAY